MCSGCVILFLGVFNLGGIVNFISHPVLVGFISAASIVIPFGLLERVFGISGLPAPFLQKMWTLATRLGEMKYLDAILGFGTLATLLILKHAKIRNEGDMFSIKTIFSFEQSLSLLANFLHY